MTGISRRHLLKSSAAGAAASVLGALPATAETFSSVEKKPSGTNPECVRSHIFTVVTPDMEASLRFYRDIIGYEVIQNGKLSGRLPTVPGVGGVGRRHALVRARAQPTDTPLIRILEAPAGARSNRPRPGASLVDPGLGGVEVMTGNDAAAYLKLHQAGVKVISPPLLTAQTGVDPMPGATVEWDFGDIDVTSFVAYGPGGEEFFISQGKSMARKPWPIPWTDMNNIGAPIAIVMITLDRWPTWDFYSNVFGMKPTKDQYMGQDPTNMLLGAPVGSYFRFGGLADGGFEWWEFRDRKPSDVPPYPTDLDRTGWAMVTLVVESLTAFRGRLKSLGISILGEGSLPSPGAMYRDGVYIRGPYGELLEVIGRHA